MFKGDNFEFENFFLKSLPQNIYLGQTFLGFSF